MTSAGSQNPASTVAFAQVASAITETVAAAADASRKELFLQNIDAAILVYAGLTGVTTATGVLLPPRGAPVRITGPLAQLAWKSISASGTPTLVVGQAT